MIVQIGLLILGLALVVFGADWLVDGASAIARKSGISEFVIGLTIVGFGTSCPELVVSLTGALKGIADISIGNVVGSNIFNTLLILGLTGVIAPIAITPENRKRDIPLTIGVTVLFIVFGLWNRDVCRWEGLVFLLLFAGYIYYCFKTDSAPVEQSEEKNLRLGVAILLVLAGLAGLVIGGRLFVDSATEIARLAGVSDKFIAITVLAGGTSLPELATCVVAAAKKKGQLALGNILGSNIFNILLILGASAVVTPLDFSSMNWVDLGVLLLSALLVFSSAWTGKKNMIDRFDGSLLLLCEAAYLTWLFATI
ncbi:MAG: calcium/sodium antiporter [Bacteroidales bacterium]|nr:calcium/sodium antiporter [Bacteroidales bacterium]